MKEYFFTIYNGFLSEISYFCKFWPLGGSTAVNTSCKVFQKWSITIHIICFYFCGAWFGR